MSLPEYRPAWFARLGYKRVVGTWHTHPYASTPPPELPRAGRMVVALTSEISLRSVGDAGAGPGDKVMVWDPEARGYMEGVMLDRFEPAVVFPYDREWYCEHGTDLHAYLTCDRCHEKFRAQDGWFKSFKYDWLHWITQRNRSYKPGCPYCGHYTDWWLPPMPLAIWNWADGRVPHFAHDLHVLRCPQRETGRWSDESRPYGWLDFFRDLCAGRVNLESRLRLEEEP